MEPTRLALHRFLLISGIFLGLGATAESAMAAPVNADDGAPQASGLPMTEFAPPAAPAWQPHA